jgi:hypothetical protein
MQPAFFREALLYRQIAAPSWWRWRMSGLTPRVMTDDLNDGLLAFRLDFIRTPRVRVSIRGYDIRV